MEYVEVTGRSVDLAIAAALEELGLSSRDEANIEVLEEGVKGFLGIGGKDAVVKVSRKPKRRRRRRRGSGGGSEKGEETRDKQGGRTKPAPQGRGRGGSSSRPAGGQPKKEKAPMTGSDAGETGDDVNEQAEMVGVFLSGLLDALGLEGAVSTKIEDGIIKAEVTGDQTEVLVGPKGSLIRTVQELARTVIQRRSPRPRRVIVDIAGYGARRRQALAIYAQRLAESVLAEGGEIMLEPMTSADRKVVHDTIADIEDVRSYSEGEEPRRCVVISVVDGYVVPSQDVETDGDASPGPVDDDDFEETALGEEE